MGKTIIHIYGASGGGTSTLGLYISEQLGYFFMDTDDYLWMPTDPKFTTMRAKEERLRLMKEDIQRYEHIVISGSLAGWGDELIPLFTHAVRVQTDTALRMERLRKRESLRFGARIEKGGDMYEEHIKFLEWASLYDDGGVNMRSKACHDEWEKLLSCKKILVYGANPVEYNLELIKELL